MSAKFSKCKFYLESFVSNIMSKLMYRWWRFMVINLENTISKAASTDLYTDREGASKKYCNDLINVFIEVCINS